MDPKPVVRRLDPLGRIVLPKKMRTKLGVEARDSLEIALDGEHVVLSKPIERCIFCAKTRNVERFHNRNVCRSCSEQLAGSSAAPQGADAAAVDAAQA